MSFAPASDYLLKTVARNGKHLCLFFGAQTECSPDTAVEFCRAVSQLTNFFFESHFRQKLTNNVCFIEIVITEIAKKVLGYSYFRCLN